MWAMLPEVHMQICEFFSSPEDSNFLFLTKKINSKTQNHLLSMLSFWFPKGLINKMLRDPLVLGQPAASDSAGGHVVCKHKLLLLIY